jgi:hypothetical protein
MERLMQGGIGGRGYRCITFPKTVRQRPTVISKRRKSMRRQNTYGRMSEADSITKLPGPKPKAEILLRFVAASLVLPLRGRADAEGPRLVSVT